MTKKDYPKDHPVYILFYGKKNTENGWYTLDENNEKIWDAQKVTEFWKTLCAEKMTKQDYDFSDFIFPEFTVENFWIGEVRKLFDYNVNFNRSSFEGQVDFGSTFFNGKAEFAYVTFNNKVYFLNTIFKDKVDFYRATFKHKIDFWLATFNKEISFHYTTFNKEVSTTLCNSYFCTRKYSNKPHSC